MTVRRRLIGVFGATVLGPLVTVLVQLVNVPVMMRIWGAHLYGEWLLISTIPAYLLLTDLGFGNVAGNDMTMRANGGDHRGAIETFQSISLLVLIVSFSLGLLLTAVIFLLPVYRLLHLSSMSPWEMKVALFILCINCLVVLQWSVIMSAYRCNGQYARGVLYVNLIRILESASFLILLISHAKPIHLAFLMLGISLLGTCLLISEKRRLIPWLPFGLEHARWARIRELAQPAVAFMAFPTGNAISLQGTTIVVGMVLGPLAVAVFNPMRTLSRTVFQLTDSVKNAVWPELSAAYGQSNWELARKLHRTACQISLWLALLASVPLALFGPRVFSIWTRGRVVMDVPTFYILLAVVIANAGWNASSVVPISANRHQRLALVYLGCTSASLAIGYLLTQHFSLKGAAIALLLCDCGMSAYVVPMSNRLVSDHWGSFAASLVDITQLKTILAKLTRRTT